MVMPIDFTNLNQYQHTLKSPFTCIGVGLHSGAKIKMTVMPAKANTGYRFIRSDVQDTPNEILATWNNVRDSHLCTAVSNRYGVKVTTIEHLIAALFGMGVDNAIIALNGAEVPIMDGSSKVFIELVQSVGLKSNGVSRKAIVIKRKVQVKEGKKLASFVPADIPIIDALIEFEGCAIGRQRIKTPLTKNLFVSELGSARTFGFARHLLTLRELGFAQGANLNNAILVDGPKIVNPDGLRFKNEFVRHKALDSVGDLALAGAPIIGCYKAKFAGHSLNNQLLRQLFRDKSAYQTIDLVSYAAATKPFAESTRCKVEI